MAPSHACLICPTRDWPNQGTAMARVSTSPAEAGIGFICMHPSPTLTITHRHRVSSQHMGVSETLIIQAREGWENPIKYNTLIQIPKHNFNPQSSVSLSNKIYTSSPCFSICTFFYLQSLQFHVL